jgi:uncharacterized protein (DUF2126 family)
VRWGTELHDRFLLPHFVLAGLRGRLEDTCAHGCPSKPEWFAPHMEFRFPQDRRFRRARHRGRAAQALEPWHVMGEEGAIGGTVRFVDSSLERLQVKVQRHGR